MNTLRRLFRRGKGLMSPYDNRGLYNTSLDYIKLNNSERAERALRRAKDQLVITKTPEKLTQTERELMIFHNIIKNKMYKKSYGRIIKNTDKMIIEPIRKRIRSPVRTKALESMILDNWNSPDISNMSHEEVILQEKIYENARVYSDRVRKMRMENNLIPLNRVEWLDHHEELLEPDLPEKHRVNNVTVADMAYVKKTLSQYIEDLVEKENKERGEPMKPLPFPINKESTEKSLEQIRKYSPLFVVLYIGTAAIGTSVEYYLSTVNIHSFIFNLEYIVPLRLLMAGVLTPSLVPYWDKLINFYKRKRKVYFNE